MTRCRSDWKRRLSPGPIIICGLSLGALLQLCAAQEVAPAPHPTAGIGRMEKTLEKEQEIRSRIDQFFTQIIAGKSTEAFAKLLKGSPLGANQEEIGRIVKDTEDMLETSGTIHSKELLRISRLGSRLIRFTYLSYSDDNPLRWEIFSYLGNSGWQILTFSVNNRIAELFDDPITRRVGSLSPSRR